MIISMSNFVTRAAASILLVSGFSSTVLAASPDPFAANNTVYPAVEDWQNKPMRVSNYAYPIKPVKSQWIAQRPAKHLSTETAPAYAAAVKRLIERDISGLVNDPLNWSPTKVGWYDMPWGAQGSTMGNGKIDPLSGREALSGSYTGQILENVSYPVGERPEPTKFQNYSVAYYNDVAGVQLGKIWRNPFKPDISAAKFPEGSIVVKVEGVNLTDRNWPTKQGGQVLRGSSLSYVYRPSVDSIENQPDPTQRKAEVIPTRFLQMAVRIKDSVASPKTGWVFIAFFYDSRSTGATVWDRTQPVGVEWGNDPECKQPSCNLKETWINPQVPEFIKYGLGWGGRLAGPLDVGVRHNVVTVSGQRTEKGKPFPASSCVSCHSTAQYPFVANLYPSPNMVFPEDGNQFLFFDPGSDQWMKWFDNRPGNKPLSDRGRGDGIVALDYDLMLTFALSQANASANSDVFVPRRRFSVH